MAYKEFLLDDIKKGSEFTESNLASRLLGKMLEDQEKKIKEIQISYPSRFSQTIKPKDNKINSVLTSVKQHIINNENTRLIYSKTRSPNEKDLRMSYNNNLPILMEKVRESYKSPLNLSIKSDFSRDEKLKFQIQNSRDQNSSSNSELYKTVNFLINVA